MLLPCSDEQAACIAIDHSPDHEIMPQPRFGNTDGFAHEAFQPGAACEMVPFHLLRVCLANAMLGGLEGTRIDVCPIRIDLGHAQRGQP
jgi:hypothetical protein